MRRFEAGAQTARFHPDSRWLSAGLAIAFSYWLALTVLAFSFWDAAPWVIVLSASFSPLALAVSVSLICHAARGDLLRLAYTDDLTGLANSRAFHRLLEVVGENDVVVMIDIDNLKLINDYCGHQAGDEALQAISEQLLAAAPPMGVVCRVGGDEFAIMLAAPAEQEIALVLQGLQPRQSYLSNCGHVHCISVSYGVEVVEKGQSVWTVFQRADESLRRMKLRPKVEVDPRLPRQSAAGEISEAG